MRRNAAAKVADGDGSTVLQRQPWSLSSSWKKDVTADWTRHWFAESLLSMHAVDE